MKHAVVIVAFTAALTSCTKKEGKADASRQKAATARTATATSSGGDVMAMRTLPAMGGSIGKSPCGAMMDSMPVHMMVMDTASGAAIQAMLPMHRKMVGTMMSRMDSTMRVRHVTPSPATSALMDSVRQDVMHMQQMTPQQIKALMPAHHDRLMRLTQGCQTMR